MITILGIAAVVLLFLLVFYIAKTSELASLIKGGDAKDEYEQTSSYQGGLSLAFLVLFFLAIGVSAYVWGPRMLPESASAHGIETDSMFQVTFWFTFIVFVLTHIALFWYTFRYRYKKDKQAAYITHNNTLEVIWTLIPAVVMVILVVKGINTWQYIFKTENVTTASESMEIKAVAKQFGWIIWYPGADGTFGKQIFDQEHVSPENELGIDWSDPASHDDLIYVDKLYLVKEKPVLMKLGAQDVLHSFFLPHFRVKMDCVPGTPTQFPFTPLYTTAEYRERIKHQRYWAETDPETGTPRYENFNFELACTELCGKSHYAMQKDVVVMTQEEYDAKMAELTPYYELVVAPDMADEAGSDESDEATASDEDETTDVITELR